MNSDLDKLAHELARETNVLYNFGGIQCRKDECTLCRSCGQECQFSKWQRSLWAYNQAMGKTLRVIPTGRLMMHIVRESE